MATIVQDTRKIIKVGSSGAVTIPADDMRRMGVTFGDELKITYEPVKKQKHDKLMDEYQEFKKQYGETLKNLANR